MNRNFKRCIRNANVRETIIKEQRCRYCYCYFEKYNLNMGQWAVLVDSRETIRELQQQQGNANRASVTRKSPISIPSLNNGDFSSLF